MKTYIQTAALAGFILMVMAGLSFGQSKPPLLSTGGGVTLDTAQTITGAKTYSAAPTYSAGVKVATNQYVNLDGTANADNGIGWTGTLLNLRAGGNSPMQANPGAGTITFGSGYTITTGPLKIGSGGTAIASSIRGSATLDFASAAVGTCSATLTIGVTGATTGAEVALGVPNGSVGAGSDFFAWVSAADTVSVRHCSHNGTNDPASGTFTVRVFNP